MADNLNLYNKWRTAPENALKPITAGNLKGKSDINPQWRIQVLTETFGPVGFGWYTKIIEHWTDTETIGGKLERVAWVRVELYVKVGGEWSAPIEGIGGSKYAGKGRGDELNDEAFKMAETDAISVACKKLGIAADVYWNSTSTKYSATQPEPQQQQRTNYKPIGLHPEDIEWRNWLVKCAADGYSREQCEPTANKSGRTIPTDVWNKVLEAI